MVRISDIVQLKAPQTEAASGVSSAAIGIVVPPAAPVPNGSSSGSGFKAAESQSLYADLVLACQRSMEEARDEQAFRLGPIVSLTERLIDRVIQRDAELFRLSTVEDGGFSLARHGVNVAILSVRLGMGRDYKKPRLVDLALAAMLHDIGMMKVGHLVNTAGALNPDQRAQMHEHPVVGHRLVEHCRDLDPFVCDIVAQEHERDDGSGYPHGLVGNRIHEQAQIVGLLDCYEALIHDRPYRGRLLPAEAMRVMLTGNRDAFRRELWRAFLDEMPVFPVDTWVRLTSGELARVVSVRREAQLSPVVTLLTDRDGHPRFRSDTIDLSKEPRLAIDRAVPEPLLAE